MTNYSALHHAEVARRAAEGNDTEAASIGLEHSAKEWANQEANNYSVKSTGSTTFRALKDRFADVINVKDFGAKGDGTTDDTDAIQAAINNSQSRKIIFNDGIYKVTSEIAITNPCIIDGNNCTIKSTNPENTGLFTISAENVKVLNINFTNDAKPDSLNRTGSFCIKVLKGSKNVLIDKCTFYNFRVCVYSTTGNDGLIENISITNCHFDKYDQGCLLDDFDGVLLYGCIGDNVEMTQYNQSLQTYDPPHILYVTDRSYNAKKNLIVMKCIERGNKYSSSYKVRNCDGVVLNGNISDGCCRGIEINVCDNVSITNNVIKDMIVTDSTLNGTDNYQSSIWLSGVTHSIVASNLTTIPTSLPIWHIRLTLDTNFPTKYNENIKITNNLCIFNAYTNRDNIIGSYLKNCIIQNNSYINVGASDNGYISHIDNSEKVRFLKNSYNGPASSKRYVGFTDCTDCLALYDVNEVDGQSVSSTTNGTDLLLSNQTIRQRGFSGVVDVPTQWNEKCGFRRVSDGLGFWCSTTSGTSTEVYEIRPSASGNLFYINNKLEPKTDNTFNLGSASLRWKEVFSATGAINTSDERQKDNIQEIDERVFKAWSKVDFKQFVFKEAIKEKGENARIHIGVIAQSIKDAFESEGLDGFKYGLLCYDEWGDEYANVEVIDEEATYDENGNELTPAKTHMENKLVKKAGNSFGVRYTEALSLECAYQRWMTEKLEKRLEALEVK